MDVLVLGAGDDTLGLDTFYVSCRMDTREEWVCAWAFPVPTCSCVPSKIHHRPETVSISISNENWDGMGVSTNATLTPFPLNSAPIASPRFFIRFLSQVIPALRPEGKTEL